MNLSMWSTHTPELVVCEDCRCAYNQGGLPCGAAREERNRLARKAQRRMARVDGREAYVEPRPTRNRKRMVR